MKSKPGLIILLAGVLCVTAAAGLFVFNTVRSAQAGNESRHAVEVLTEVIGKEASKSHNLPTDDPDREMPAIEAEGERYLGILDIPALGLTLPVGESLDDDALQSTPCRYSGSIYSCDLVIGAHNYGAHFGNISTLHIGDEVNFTDAEGHVYPCEVVDLETLRPEQTEELTTKNPQNDWDMTLFTCTYSGVERTTVRCKMVKK